MTPLPFDEMSRRRPEFQGGAEILMPDGALWYAVSPTARYAPDQLAWTFGDLFPDDLNRIASGALLKIVRKYLAAVTDVMRTQATLELVWFLLALNYELSRDEFAALVGLASTLGEVRTIALGASFHEIAATVIGRAQALRESN